MSSVWIVSGATTLFMARLSFGGLRRPTSGARSMKRTRSAHVNADAKMPRKSCGVDELHVRLRAYFSAAAVVRSDASSFP
jgi:hypothetical protein